MFPRRNFYTYYPLINKLSKYIEIKCYSSVQKYQIFKKPSTDLSMTPASGTKNQYNNNIIALYI